MNPSSCQLEMCAQTTFLHATYCRQTEYQDALGYPSGKKKKKESLPISLMYQHDQGQSPALTLARPVGGWLATSVTLRSQVPEMWPPEPMTQVGPLGGSSRWNLQCKRLRNLSGSVPQSLSCSQNFTQAHPGPTPHWNMERSRTLHPPSPPQGQRWQRLSSC